MLKFHFGACYLLKCIGETLRSNRQICCKINLNVEMILKLSLGCKTLNPSTINVIVDIPSKKKKKKKRARENLSTSGNFFLVRVVIYNKIERV